MEDLKHDALLPVKLLEKRIITVPPILDGIDIEQRRRLAHIFLAPVLHWYLNEGKNSAIIKEYFEGLLNKDFEYDLLEEDVRRQSLSDAHDINFSSECKLVALGVYNTTSLGVSSAALLKVSFSAALANALASAGNAAENLLILSRTLDTHDLLLLKC
jgi:hypothetical protein